MMIQLQTAVVPAVPDVPKMREETSFFQIIRRILICVCFPFKADVPVCLAVVPAANQQNQVFDQIPQIKEDQKHFF
jgi:hypothetical protein